ncbi:MAG: UDP-N-acetylmuramoyl-L-alanyl-D-glutamate--2,6-diaminopimelate ligase [Bacteroidetes bacterium]|nr:UDP-N-acetylmuramoyl-L-alanyl-D-glutamate--2,6-diaminopimelate ligase [Bacteroidota bacterium]
MHQLKEILYNTNIIEVIGSTEIDINNMYLDSTKVEPGGLFSAIRGTTLDGHDFIDEAIKKGAVAIICETLPAKIQDGITYVSMQKSDRATGIIAGNFHDNPSSKLKLVGVTGTNGKTTIVTLLFNLFRSLGYKVGMMSTIQNNIQDEVIEATLTTPNSLEVHKLLDMMVDKSCEYAFMEVSSHALSQYRVAGVKFTGGVFTNLTHEHLDYHKNFDNYIKTKKQFFDNLDAEAFALTNLDDKHGNIMVQNTKAKKYTYSLKSLSDYKAKILENSFSGLLMNIEGEDVSTKFIGEFNAYNLLAVYGTAVLLDQEEHVILTKISNLGFTEGRFEYIISKNNIKGIVDYAHTPDALKQALNAINSIRTGDEKVVTIIGCGGDRDTAKRPLMAKIAVDGSDHVILTSDNPRTEDPQKIIEEMKAGVSPENEGKVLAIIDRKEAIRMACTLAGEGDIILLAGKGHEKYQETNGVKKRFDDREILIETLNLLNK